MALDAATGSITVSGTGSLSVTGLSFQPKVVMIWHGGGAGTAALYHIFGAAASSSAEWACESFSADNNNTSATHAAGRTDCCVLLRDISTVYVQADFTSFNSDGFTLNVSTSSGTQTLFYLALGGSDLTDVAVGTTLVPASGATHAVTGLSFQPDLVLMSTIGQQDWPSTGVNAACHLGAMTADAQGGVMGFSDNGQGTSSTNTYQLSTAVVPFAAGSTPAQFLLWSKSSLDSGGFTLSLDDLGTTGSELGYIALKFTSADWVKLGTETQPTSATTKQTTGLGLTPDALFLFGGLLASSTSPQNESNLSIGAWDGTNHRGYSVSDQDAQNFTNNARTASTTKAILKINGSGTTISEADVSASGSDSFTLNWTTADATAREFFYIAMGDPGAAPPADFVPDIMVF